LFCSFDGELSQEVGRGVGSRLQRVAELLLFNDELSKEINCCLHVYYTRVAELLLPIVELQKPAQLESEPLSCDMYGALNNVRTMPRASHRGTGKRRVNQVNEGKRGFKAKERGLSRCKGYMYRRKESAKPDRALGSLKDARSSRRLGTLVTEITLTQRNDYDLAAETLSFLHCKFIVVDLERFFEVTIHRKNG